MTKYKISMLFLFIVFLCTFTFVNAEEYEPVLLGKTIYIDPGHGGADPGAIYKEIKESEINLSISKNLKEELEKYGATVYLTRSGNYDLSENNAQNKKRNDLTTRSRLINESMCDMYISIHLNSDSSPTWYGAQVFYTNKNKENQKIAEIMQKILKENLNTKREAKNIKNTYLYERITRPGILVEAGFISNSNDRYLLNKPEYQQKIANIITQGIIEYLK